ncbi:MAG: transglycosylase SLT domain-containing protein [Asticcacaulis sp.]
MKLTVQSTPYPLSQMVDQTGSAIQAGSAGVVGSLQRAAEATGVDFGYLMKAAQRESSLNPNAHARTSSAAGLFQFIEQTWLGMVKTAGPKHGYGAYAAQIVKGGDGKYHVPDANIRKQVLGLRYNSDANAVMAAEMTAGHAAYLKGRIGRDPTQGELYAAHFLGPDGAADLIQASDSRPHATAAALFPAAARSNHGIFYHHGRPLNVAEVMSNLKSVGGGAPMPLPDATPGEETGDVLMARLDIDRMRGENAVMQLVFGDSGAQGLLLQTQLLSAFGPGDDAGDEAAASLTKAFGTNDDTSLA